MEVLLVLFSVLIVGIGGFYTVCHIIKLWTGCNYNEAVSKLHNIMNGKVQYQFCNDMGFANEVWKNVRNIIGDKRYQQLVYISNTAIAHNSYPLEKTVVCPILQYQCTMQMKMKSRFWRIYLQTLLGVICRCADMIPRYLLIGRCVMI